MLTYKTSLDFALLFTEYHLIDSIFAVCFVDPCCRTSHQLQILDFHAQNISAQESDMQHKPEHAESVDLRALSETLKLVFNLIQFYPKYSQSFQILLRPVLALLQGVQIQPDPLQAPVNYIINVLLNIELEASEGQASGETSTKHQTSIFPAETPTLHIERLVQIVAQAIRSYSEDSLESKIIPLLTLVRRLVEIAPEATKEYMSRSLLPSDTDRDLPLGSSDSLASKLLKLSITPAAPQVREGVSSLLFELSDQDPASFVRNVGYGYASGYLMSHKIPLPPNALEEDVGEKVTNVDGREINPITGQRRDKEPPDPAENMTDEEKEREAERLFVLFERLKSTGMVSVMNPVEVAAREGRLQEVHSSDSE